MRTVNMLKTQINPIQNYNFNNFSSLRKRRSQLVHESEQLFPPSSKLCDWLYWNPGQLWDDGNSLARWVWSRNNIMHNKCLDSILLFSLFKPCLVAQATSLLNIRFVMSRTLGNTHKGIFIENGSGGFMSNLKFEVCPTHSFIPFAWIDSEWN